LEGVESTNLEGVESTNLEGVELEGAGLNDVGLLGDVKTEGNPLCLVPTSSFVAPKILLLKFFNLLSNFESSFLSQFVKSLKFTEFVPPFVLFCFVLVCFVLFLFDNNYFEK